MYTRTGVHYQYVISTGGSEFVNGGLCRFVSAREVRVQGSCIFALCLAG